MEEVRCIKGIVFGEGCGEMDDLISCISGGVIWFVWWFNLLGN